MLYTATNGDATEYVNLLHPIPSVQTPEINQIPCDRK